ncbi:MAG: hypothetical protein NXH82_02265 [Rhodobacteraceae bacterium]|nr:hypothetical protein [Paracoccaceae bacterium]
MGHGSGDALSDVLQRLAGALREQAETAHELDSAIATLPDTSGHGAGLQRIDLLRQSLEDLARYTCVLSDSVPPDWATDTGPAAEVLKLGAMVRQMTAGQSGTCEGRGDVQLF